MSSSEIAATLGVLGFLISCVNVWRSIQSAKQAQSLAFAQKKQEALALVIEGEIGNMAARRQLRALRYEAMKAEATDVAEQAAKFIADHDRAISRLGDLRLGLQSLVAGTTRHKDLLEMVESRIAQIKQVTDAKWMAEGVGEYVDEARENLSLRKQLQAKRPPGGTSANEL